MNAPARNFPQREKNALDDYKLRLTADPLPNGKGRPTLGVQLSNNNPRFVVYTQVQNDKDNGKIQAELDLPAMHFVLTALREAAAAPGEYQVKLENKNFTWFQGKKSETPQLVSKVIVGKDKEGVVFISVLSKDNDRPKIKFPFGLSHFHEACWVKPGSSEPFTKAELSARVSLAWASMIERVLDQLFSTMWKEPVKKDQGGGGGGNRGGYGGGGGGNRGGGGGNDWSGGGSGSNDFDDDIPL